MAYADPTNYALPFQSDSVTSRDASLKARKFIGQQGDRVLGWFEGQGVEGGTQKDVSLALGVSRASVCARVNALEQVGDLVKTDLRRDGCSLYIGAAFKPAFDRARAAASQESQ
jgi:hypothetical protein